MQKFIITVSAIFLMALSSIANAAVVLNATGLSGTFVTETFNINAGHGTAAASQFSGITFNAGNVVNNDYSGSFPNMSGSVIANFDDHVGNCCTDPTSFAFSNDLSELAFAFVSNLQSTTFSLYLNGAQVESDVISTAYSGQFINFTGLIFDEVRITSTGSNDAYLIDNMQLKSNTVPEPGTFALVGLAMIGGFARHRKTQK